MGGRYGGEDRAKILRVERHREWKLKVDEMHEGKGARLKRREGGVIVAE